MQKFKGFLYVSELLLGLARTECKLFRYTLWRFYDKQKTVFLSSRGPVLKGGQAVTLVHYGY